MYEFEFYNKKTLVFYTSCGRTLREACGKVGQAVRDCHCVSRAKINA